MLRRLPIVAVFGQGSAIAAERAELARAVGAMVAGLGAHLLTGAGYGTMAAAAEGFTAVEARRGLSIGIVPCRRKGAFDTPKRDPEGRPYPNRFVEIAIHTPLPSRPAGWRAVPTRNHVNVLTADAIMALPGRVGTRNELDMAAHYRDEQARPREQRRTLLIGPADEFTARHRALFVHAADIAAAERHLAGILAAQQFTDDEHAAA
jgi:predicted Rossmann-fold nucleotide-binding protein